MKSLVGENGICDAEKEKITKRMRFFDSEIRSLFVEVEKISKNLIFI